LASLVPADRAAAFRRTAARLAVRGCWLTTPRAGVGKTTSVVQLAAAFAAQNRSINVLLVDFSIHGDSTSQLLGAPRLAASCAGRTMDTNDNAHRWHAGAV
jgi:Mrp family chromosome partitioning ATPase